MRGRPRPALAASALGSRVSAAPRYSPPASPAAPPTSAPTRRSVGALPLGAMTTPTARPPHVPSPGLPTAPCVVSASPRPTLRLAATVEPSAKGAPWPMASRLSADAATTTDGAGLELDGWSAALASLRALLGIKIFLPEVRTYADPYEGGGGT